jgi:hypothetical protein
MPLSEKEKIVRILNFALAVVILITATRLFAQEAEMDTSKKRDKQWGFVRSSSAFHLCLFQIQR